MKKLIPVLMTAILISLVFITTQVFSQSDPDVLWRGDAEKIGDLCS